MSHFTTVRLQLKNKELLKQVLEEKGHKVVENTRVRGYMGNATNAELVVQRANKYDIGFNRKGESLEMIADFWGVGISGENFMADIQQDYARYQLLETAHKQGFSVELEEVTSKGEIRIVLGKWV